MIPCGIAIEFPYGYDVQVRPRSGLSAKGVGVAFGTVDADYRGELLVTMYTLGDLKSYELQDGDRIQLGNVVLRFQMRAARGRRPTSARWSAIAW